MMSIRCPRVMGAITGVEEHDRVGSSRMWQGCSWGMGLDARMFRGGASVRLACLRRPPRC